MIDRDRSNVTQTRGASPKQRRYATSRLVPAPAALPPALEWHMVGFQEPPSGESRLRCTMTVSRTLPVSHESAPIGGRPRRDVFGLSIVVPCFDEQEVIGAAYASLREVAQSITDNYELIFIDDGSRDDTFAILREICRGNHHIRCLKLSRNFGHQIAVTAGLDAAAGDAVVIIDADLQDPPKVIIDMVEKWRAGFDVVYGQREARQGESRFKLCTAHLFYRVVNALSEVPIPRDTGDFRLIDRCVVDAIRMMPERHRLLRGMTSWIGFNQTSVRYVRAPRLAGTSKYPLRKMINLALDGIVSFSVKPLRLVAYLGATMFCLSLLGILYALMMRLLTEVWVPGWTLLFIGSLFFSGVQFIVLGILGEYLGRVYSEVKGRPLYLVAAREGAALMKVPQESAAE
jgi:polyisoprenyl-phosphate glycosyltransferase